MISNNERREVVARLRKIEVHCWYDGMDEVDSLETAIGCSIGQDWQDQNWQERLVDLIEPEPEHTTTRSGKFKTKYGNRVPLCECYEYSIGDKRYNYCPKCGTKIISGKDTDVLTGEKVME